MMIAGCMLYKREMFEIIDFICRSDWLVCM